MDTATVPLTTPAATGQLVAGVISVDAAARRRAARLLEDAGFVVQEDSAVLDPPAFVVVLLTDGTDAERLATLRATASAQPDVPMLAVVPADATNASLRRMLLAGASGIVLDDDMARTLAPTVRATLAGQLTVPAALSRQIAPRPLSHREKQILALVMLGRTNREIAQTLFLAESTVKTHLSSAFRKLDARSRSEAVTKILDPESGYSTTIREIAHGSFSTAR